MALELEANRADLTRALARQGVTVEEEVQEEQWACWSRPVAARPERSSLLVLASCLSRVQYQEDHGSDRDDGKAMTEKN